MNHYLYRLYDAAGVLLYVGISKSAIHRLHQHLEAQPWADQIASQTVERFASRRELEDAERAAIKAEKPRFNKAHNSEIATQRRKADWLQSAHDWVESDKMELRVGDHVALGLRNGACHIGRIVRMTPGGTALMLAVPPYFTVSIGIAIDNILGIRFSEQMDQSLLDFQAAWESDGAA